MMFSGNFHIYRDASELEYSPYSGTDLRNSAWHVHEVIDRACGDPTTAERLVRISTADAPAPLIFVRGWILHPDREPRYLHGWHRVIRGAMADP